MQRWRFRAVVSAGLLVAVICLAGCAKVGGALHAIVEAVPVLSSEADDAARFTKLGTWADNALASAGDLLLSAKSARDEAMHDPNLGPLLQQACGAIIAHRFGRPVDIPGRMQSLRNSIQAGKVAALAEDVEVVVAIIQAYADGKVDQAEVESKVMLFNKLYCS